MLLSKIYTVESRHKHAPTPSLELMSLRRKITDLLQYKAKVALQFCHKMSYESGEKALARSITEHKLTTYIPHILPPNGQKAVLPKQIVQEFRDFITYQINLLPKLK